MPSQLEQQEQQFYPFTMNKGINLEDAETILQPGQARDAMNFIFERQELRTRPNLKQITSGTIAQAIVQAVYFYADDGINTPLQNFHVWRGADGHTFYQYIPGGAATAITGPATAFVVPATQGVRMVNFYGAILIGGQSSGLWRWLPQSGTVYTIVTGVAPKYVSQHLSRAIAAYDLSASTYQAARTVMWSVAGDETTWTGATNGSGTSILDISDIITGLCTLHNVVVVVRSSGFSLGTPTGQAFPAYSFQKWSDQGTGCAFPDTLAVCDNVAYFMGTDNVYSFNLYEVAPIGEAIKTQLLQAQSQFGGYVGFITRTVQGGAPDRFKLYYNLYPNNQVTNSGGTPCPHFVYSISDQTWSKHNYAQRFTPVVQPDNSIISTPTFIDTATTPGSFLYNAWYNGAESPSLGVSTCEMPAYITSGNIQLGSQDTNAAVERVLVRARNFNNQSIQITLSSKYDAFTARSKSVTIPCGSAANDGLYYRSWADAGRFIGQDWVVRIDVPANAQFCSDGLGLLWEPDGVFRG